MVNDHRHQWSNRPWPYWVLLGVIVAALVSFRIEWAAVLEWWSVEAARNSGQAAWVQAIGTLAALAIAIGVPWYIHKKEGQKRATDRLHQAQGLALLIRPSLVVLKGKLEREFRLARNGAAPAEFRAIKMPKTITGQIDQLWMMGSAGGHALQLVSTLEADAQNLDEFTHYMSGADQDLNTINRMLANRARILESAHEDTIDALTEIEAILAA